MKVYHPSEKLTSLKTQILQLQLTLELSQIHQILSAYSDLLLFFAEYSFLFINDSTQTPVLNDKHSNFEGCFITQDPARDGSNWYGYCGQNPINRYDPSGLNWMDREGNWHSNSEPGINYNVGDETTSGPQGETGPTETPKVPEVPKQPDTTVTTNIKDKSPENVNENIKRNELNDNTKNIKMKFSKSKKTLKITSSLNGKKNVILIKLTNNVRSKTERGKPIEYNGYFYYPENFPNGEWNITDWGISSDGTIGPYIRTDAGRFVDTFKKDENGNFVETGSQVYDTGYNLHGGDQNGEAMWNNNEEYSTWGCGRGKNSDIRGLQYYLNEMKKNGGKATIIVED